MIAVVIDVNSIVIVLCHKPDLNRFNETLTRESISSERNVSFAHFFLSTFISMLLSISVSFFCLLFSPFHFLSVILH